MPKEHCTIEERFFSKVKKTDSCWLWTGGITTGGYGSFRLNGKNQPSHRVSYQLFVGPIPEGLFVLHKCDIPACVLPDHLFLGTQLDNIADRHSKGRSRGGSCLGEKHPNVKLTAMQVDAIRVKYANFPRVGTRVKVGLLKFLADEFGINIDYAWCIANKRSR